MYNLIISTLLTLGTFSATSGSDEKLPEITSFDTREGVEVIHLEYEKHDSEVYITLLLQVDDSVLSVTSVSHSYVEATEQLNEVIAAAATK